MAETEALDCRVIRPVETYAGKQGFEYAAGISRESVGARAICMHLLELAPGQRAKAHLHENHETAIYALTGETEMWYGERLERRLVLKAGELLLSRRGCRICRRTSRIGRPRR